jgi:NitT/TauT family transport system permease protein
MPDRPPEGRGWKFDLHGRWADRALLLLTLSVFLGAWEAAVRGLGVAEIVLPAPSAIGIALWNLFRVGTLPKHLGITLVEILVGFGLGAIAGVALGAVIALSSILRRILYPYIIVLQVVPKVAIAPLFIIWLGFGIESKILMAVLISFFPLLVNTIAGLQNVPPEYLDLMTAVKAGRWETFRYVRFPSALPYLFAGLEAAIVLAVIGAIVGEFVGASVGLGYLIMLYNTNLNVPGVFAVIVVLSAAGLVLHAAVIYFRRRIVFWIGTEQVSVTGA